MNKPRIWTPALLALLGLPASCALAQPDAPPPPAPAAPAAERVYTPAEIARVIGDPSTLTLHLRDVPPAQVFDQVAAQSGVRLTPIGSGAAVSVDCAGLPFWDGMKSVLKQSGFAFEGYAGNVGTMLPPANQAGANAGFLAGPRVVDGPFIVQFESCALAKSRQVTFFPVAAPNQLAAPGDAGPVENSHLRIEGEVLSDPKLRIFDCITNVTTLIDDTGKSLLYERPGINAMAFGGMGHAAPIHQVDRAPSPSAKLIATMAGTVRLRAVVHGEKWEIADPLKAGEVIKRCGAGAEALTYTLKAIHRDPADANSLDLVLAIAGNTQSIGRYAATILGSARWFDAAGKPIACDFLGSGGGGGQDGILSLRANCELKPDDTQVGPFSLALDIPTDIRAVAIPFAFSDLPLASLPAMAALVRNPVRVPEIHPQAHKIDDEDVFTPEQIAREMGEPSTLTLHLHDVSSREALAAVTAQSGVSFAFFPMPARLEHPVSIDCDKQPFWAALQTVLHQSGSTLLGDFGGGGYRLLPVKAGSPGIFSGRMVEAGPFTVLVNTGVVSGTRQVSFEQVGATVGGQDGQENRTCAIAGRVICDPKLRILSSQATVATADDDKGESLKEEANGFPFGFPNREPQIAGFSLALKQPAPGATLLKTLSGSVDMLVVTHTEKWAISDPLHAPPVTRQFGDGPTTYTLQAKQSPEDDGSIEVTCTIVADEQQDRPAEFLDQVRWLDAQGAAIDCVVNSMTSAGGARDTRTVVATYRRLRPDAQAPASLVVNVPTEVRTVRVPFEFHDLPLP